MCLSILLEDSPPALSVARGGGDATECIEQLFRVTRAHDLPAPKILSLKTSQTEKAPIDGFPFLYCILFRAARVRVFGYMYNGWNKWRRLNLGLLLDSLVNNDRLVLGDVVELGGEGVTGLPLGRLAGRNFGHTHVGLLEGQALELGDKEVCKRNAKAAETAPEEKHLGAEGCLVLADEVWSNDSYLDCEYKGQGHL